MIIDERKVNLAEKDIEQWLWENPGSVWCRFGAVDRWIKRQYILPSGVADLVGVTDCGTIVVVEVKNVAIDAAALTQVSRYAFDLTYISILATRDDAPSDMRDPETQKVVIGRSIDTQTLREAEALGIEIICFDVQLSLTTSPVKWKDEFRSDRRSAYDELAKDETWEIVADQAIESWKQRNSQEEQRVANTAGTVTVT